MTGASSEEVINVIDVFRKQGRSFLMPPEEKILIEEAVIDISHESIMWIWSRLAKWVRQEAESAEIFNRIAESAHLHYKKESKASLLTSPELEIALAWEEDNLHNENWAQRHVPSASRPVKFKDVIRYLGESKRKRDEDLDIEQRKRESEIINEKRLREQDQQLHDLENKQHLQEKFQLEQIRKQQRLYLKYAINVAWILGVAVVVSISLMIKAFESEKLAEQAQLQALEERDKAKIAESIAEDASVRVQEEKDFAEKARDDAELQKLKAFEAQTDAEIARDLAYRQKIIAEQNSRLAEDLQNQAASDAVVANRAKQRAEFLAQLAKNAENTSNAAKYLAEAKEIAVKSTFKRVDDLTAIEMALQSYEFNLLANKLLAKDTTRFEPEVLYALQNAFLLNNDDELFKGQTYATRFSGELVAFYSKDQALEIKKIGRDKEVGFPQLKRYAYPVRSSSIRKIAISPDNRLIANGTADGKISYRSLKEGQPWKIVNLDDRRAVPTQLEFARVAGKDWLIAGLNNNLIRIWGIDKGELISEIKLESRLTNMVNINSEYLLVSDDLGRIFQWDLATIAGNPIPELAYDHRKNDYPSPIRSMAFNGSDMLAIGDSDGEVTVFHYNQGIRNIKSFLKLHKGFVSGLAFGPRDNHLASASLDGTIFIWELGSGYNEIEQGQIPLQLGINKQIFSLSFDETGQFLIFTDNSKIRFRPVTGHNIYYFLEKQVNDLVKNR